MNVTQIDFIDPWTEQDVSVFVESALVCDGDKNTLSKNVFFCLETSKGTISTSVYLPRKKAKKIIKAMKEALDEG